MIKDRDAAKVANRDMDMVGSQIKQGITAYLNATANRHRPELVSTRLNNIATKKDPSLLGFIAAAYLDLPNSEKQRILENTNFMERSKIIQEHIRAAEVEENNAANLEKRLV
jgi:ATP-dependent Lon protease